MSLKVQCSLAECDDLIRVGSRFDGGYVVCKKDLDQSNCLLSFGIGDDFNFESEYSRLHPKSTIHSYDFSVNLLTFIVKMLGSFPRLFLGRITIVEFFSRVSLPLKYLCFFQRKSIHFKERLTNPVVTKIDVSVSKVFLRVNSQKIYLKIDIEGSEYEILEEVLKYSDRIIGFAIEFHEINFLQEKFRLAIAQISKSFVIVHVHGNNYGYRSEGNGVSDVLELTFSKKGTHPNAVKELDTPIIGLDNPNNRRLPDHSFSIIS
jgi:hypothetical protein